jgi:hypothetical protein
MPLKRKQVLPALLVLLVALAVALWCWARTPGTPPQILTQPDGERFRFAGATWSTNAAPPYWPARLIRHVPATISNLMVTRLGPRLSQINQGEAYSDRHLFVWFERLTTNAPSVAPSGSIPTAVLADESGVRAGAIGFPYLASSVEWTHVYFPLVPRRSRTLTCYFYPSGYGDAALIPYGRVTFPNPAYGHFPQWKSEPLPAVHQVDDLEVRLDDLEYGNPISGPTMIRPNGSRAQRLKPVAGGPLIQTDFDFSLRSSRDSDDIWLLQSANLRDATGNVAGRTSYDSIGPWMGEPPGSGWQPRSAWLWGALWPNEAAWKLTLELKRGTGFDPGDTIIFSNVPIPAMGSTNFPGRTNYSHGLPVALTFFTRRGNIASNVMMDVSGDWATEMRIKLPANPANLAVDFLKVDTDAGEGAIYGHSEPDTYRNYYTLLMRSIPTNARTATLTLVVQKTRTVEFLVSPPQPK